MDADRLGGTIIDPRLTQISLLHIYFVLTPMPQTRRGEWFTDIDKTQYRSAAVRYVL